MVSKGPKPQPSPGGTRAGNLAQNHDVSRERRIEMLLLLDDKRAATGHDIYIGAAGRRRVAREANLVAVRMAHVAVFRTMAQAANDRPLAHYFRVRGSSSES